MVDEKGLDEEVADKIGNYVKFSGKEELLETLANDELLKSSPSAQVSHRRRGCHTCISWLRFMLLPVAYHYSI